jgi:atypical dual specificity phosphatase
MNATIRLPRGRSIRARLFGGRRHDRCEPTPAAALRLDGDLPAWTWTLNWSAVRPDLLVGSCPIAPADIDRIGECTGASAILSVQTDECRAALGIDAEALRRHGAARGLHMVDAPMRDFDVADQRRNLPAAVRALTVLLRERQRVYVHCTAGINRAPLVVLSYLAFVEMVPPDEAQAFIRRARGAAEPSWPAFEGCLEDLLEVLHPQILRRCHTLSAACPEPDALRAWYRAQSEVVRQAFLAAHPPSDVRADPHRP